MPSQAEFPITPRQNLDFDLASNIPKFWFGGDAFKTRMFDAHSLLTPSGERFFINCLRACRDGIADPQLQDDVKNFILQEGQHSMQHAQSNTRLKLQGIDVDAIEAYLQRSAESQRLRMSRSFGMALTAAYEHLTTVVANVVMEHSEYFADADPHIFALYAWHCAEELEHRAVCFDVMQKAAGVAYFTRCLALLLGTLIFQIQLGQMLNHLFRIDGYTFREKLSLWGKGLKWMYGRNGFFRIQLAHYFAYFRPGFHPLRYGAMQGYQRWAKTFNATKDPLAAGAALQLASTTI